jgi:hypothetical protein
MPKDGVEGAPNEGAGVLPAPIRGTPLPPKEGKELVPPTKELAGLLPVPKGGAPLPPPNVGRGLLPLPKVGRGLLLTTKGAVFAELSEVTDGTTGLLAKAEKSTLVVRISEDDEAERGAVGIPATLDATTADVARVVAPAPN